MKRATGSPIIFFSLLIIGFSFLSCKSSKKIAITSNATEFFKIGHRGTRGLMPENTIPAMTRGISEGANTIEMDVHITKDGEVVVYHDASFNPDYTSMPDGSDIKKENRQQYIFYQNNYADIRKFIIGKKDYPAFPHQQKLSTYAPLLSELIDSVEIFTKTKAIADVYYLVEIKSSERTDGIEQPAPEEFIKKLMAVLTPKNLGHRLIIQSFDMRPLQVLHREYPHVILGFLTDNKQASFESNIERLGFNPAFYNPNYNLVNEELVKKCHAAKMMIEPWTVNTLDEMRKMKALGVDGIITDYPNLFKDLQE